jgi:hypothetical protein
MRKWWNPTFDYVIHALSNQIKKKMVKTKMWKRKRCRQKINIGQCGCMIHFYRFNDFEAK